MNSVARLTLCAVIGLASGCEACRAKPKLEGPAPTGASETKDKFGTLTGSIRLAPGATLPSYRAEDMERRVLQHIQGGTFPDVCTPPKLTDRTPVIEGPEGKLIGVMVAASEYSQLIKREPKVFDIVIKDCRLSPRLVVGQMGDMINLKNEVQFPFMPTYGANAYNETLTPGQSKALKLDKAGVDNVLCGFTAPCGRTDVVVLRHPLFAVTDDTGNFKIEEFPADETVRLSAWHPLFQDANISVKVARGETKNVEFVLTPAPQPAPTPEPAATPKPEETQPEGKAPKKAPASK